MESLPADWSAWRRRIDLDAYERRWQRLAAAGVDPHGEVALVQTYAPRLVLDAGCGTGRVAAELARRGVAAVGVDNDPDMIAAARTKAPDLRWIVADLADLDLPDRFDVVVLAGNVPLFTRPGTQDALVAACALHVAPGGALVAGFQTDQHYALAAYDAACTASGLRLDERWGTWDRQPYVEGADYAVSVHRAPP